VPTSGHANWREREIETAAMTRLRQESHARMLGNGMCTRPVELDCRMETICETCAYFETGLVTPTTDRDDLQLPAEGTTG
jgi:hypothetical protein